MASYKAALTQYKVALSVNDISYRATMTKYWADWQAALASFKTLKDAFDSKVAPINATRKSAINAAAATLGAAPVRPTKPVAPVKPGTHKENKNK